MRSHVFPFIEPGFRLIDNEAVNSLGPEEDIVFGEWATNEDKSIEWYITPWETIGVGWFYLSKNDNEILIDFNETPDDVYSKIGPPTGSVQLSLRAGLWKSGGNSGDIDVDLKLIPGSVFCVARKNSEGVPTVRVVLGYGTDQSDTNYNRPFSDGLFSDPYGVGSLSLSNGEWATFMFDGKRFVLLGSNNWF